MTVGQYLSYVLMNSIEFNLKVELFFDDGFFISIPCDKPKEVSSYLMEKNTFVVALGKGLRFAPCAVSEEKCRRSPQLILDAIKAVEGC